MGYYLRKIIKIFILINSCLFTVRGALILTTEICTFYSVIHCMNLPHNHENERHTIQTHTRVRRPASHPTLRRHPNPSSPAPVKSGKVLRRTPHAPIIAPLLPFVTHVGICKLLKTSCTMHASNANPGDRTRRPSSRKTNALPTELTRLKN